MRVLVIGMDNTGKSTLCEQLVGRLHGYTVKKSTGKASEEIQHAYVLQSIMDSMFGQDIIYDRFPVIDEMVYGEKLRGKSNFRPEHLFMVKELVTRKIIYCRPKITKILEFGDREQMDGVKENAMRLIEAYDEVAVELAHNGFNIRTYNYEVNTLDQIIDFIKGGN